jgi:diacylglycerol kinase family enzyme
LSSPETLSCLDTKVDPQAALIFIVNATSGHNDQAETRQAIEAALNIVGRPAEFWPAEPAELAFIAEKAAALSKARGGAVIAVGGDGTINAVAQAAHRHKCVMGVVPQGTFNYFARTHGLPSDARQAVECLLDCIPVPVQVGLVNDRVFLVNASLGLYPELLEDREAYKARFGRSRFVAFVSTIMTLLGKHRQLKLRIELGETSREITTPTIFVGNNRLQLEQVGLPEADDLDDGCVAAVVLRPIGSLTMLWLLLRGSFGKLGEEDTVESFKFQRMVVKPKQAWRGHHVKVAYDGEVNWLEAPLEFRVAPQPLYLLKPKALDRKPEPENAQP